MLIRHACHIWVSAVVRSLHFSSEGKIFAHKREMELCSFDAGPIVAGCILGLVVESSEVSTSSRSGDGLSSGVVKHVEVDLYLSSGHASCTWLVARW